MREFYRIFASLLLLIVFSFSATAFPVQTAEDRQNKTLRWRNPTISIAVSNSLIKPNFNIKEGSDIAGAVRRSLETWEKAAAVKFEETTTDKQTVSPSGNIGDGINLITIAQTSENFLLFGKDAEEVAARTRVFFNKKGAITEADIVLNPYQQFSTDGSIGTFDLESILTHEIGHLLGLEHSTMLGATMHESSGKNGVYNLPAFDSRTLAETDLAAVRTLYGGKTEAEICCGSITGKLSAANGKAVKNYQVWAEEKETGKVSAEVLADAEGGFQLGGLTPGTYRVFAQRSAENKAFAVEELGEAQVGKGRSANLTKQLNQAAINFQARYIGFNGQLSDNSVSLNSGKSYKIYVGGKNLNAEDYKLSFHSPFINVVPKTSVKLDFGENISVISFDVLVENHARVGEYSLFIESKDGQKAVVIGALSIEKFNNPWSIFSLDAD
ncbi:MAG TPA: matrixin family metalloprotease [Pyrinomonadaceae bacterium]|jgi:hypothetical protein